MPTIAKGVRNNNPTNLRHVPANKWQGLASPPADKDGFCIFISPAYGIRAGALNIIAYQDRYTVRTIRALVERWAPWSENNVEAYIASVEKRTGFDRDKRLDFHLYEHLRPVIVAMIRHECGSLPYTSAVIDQGLMLAGIVASPVFVDAPEPKPASQDKRVVAPLVGTGLGMASQAVAQIEPIWNFFSRVHPWAPHIMLAILGIGAIIAGGVFLWDYVKERRRIAAAA